MGHGSRASRVKDHQSTNTMKLHQVSQPFPGSTKGGTPRLTSTGRV